MSDFQSVDKGMEKDHSSLVHRVVSGMNGLKRNEKYINFQLAQESNPLNHDLEKELQESHQKAE